MRKPWRIALTTVGAIIAIPALLLATAAVINVIATAVEKDSIESYGQFVPVDGKQMNVVVSGTGDETIVLLPGLGTAAPGLDFGPLIDELDDTYRVVAVEPFGTGLSDATEAPRTAENITREVHEALQQLDVDRFALMGHSIAGIYALNYAAAYHDELTAFVGIDSSVPDQPGMDDPVPTSTLVTLRHLGITRILTAIAGDPYAGLPYDDHVKEQMSLLTTKNATASTLIDEMDHIPANFAAVSGMTFPPDLPVLLFVVSDDAEVPGWMALHEEQAASVDFGQVIPMAGEHYLHHTLSKEIAQDTAVFLSSR